MSIKINTNVSAMTSMRHLRGVESRMANSITRLSTGLRINSGADDPSGMMMSESLRAHISGLEQASRNVQDAINLTKTADSALDEMQGFMRDLRALAIHAANRGVVDDAMLQADQTQVDSILGTIDRIGKSTAWGDKKLLDGSSGLSTNITRSDLIGDLSLGSEANGKVIGSGAVSMTQVTAATRATATMSAVHTDADTALGVDGYNAGTVVLNGVAFAIATTDTANGVIAKFNAKTDETGVTASYDSTANKIVLTQNKFGSNFSINYQENVSILNGGSAATPTAGVNGVYDLTFKDEDGADVTERFTGGQGSNDGLTLTAASGNRVVLSAAGNAEAGPLEVANTQAGTVKFQIGNTADDVATFALPKMSAATIGTGAVTGKSLADLDLRTEDGAQEALQIIDKAIEQLSKVRGQMGAFQKNVLESTVRSLGVATEMFTASESQLRDADIAKEMTEFTKIQILRQSGMAILAQAQQAPQNVLSLIQG